MSLAGDYRQEPGIIKSGPQMLKLGKQHSPAVVHSAEVVHMPGKVVPLLAIELVMPVAVLTTLLAALELATVLAATELALVPVLAALLFAASELELASEDEAALVPPMPIMPPAPSSSSSKSPPSPPVAQAATTTMAVKKITVQVGEDSFMAATT